MRSRTALQSTLTMWRLFVFAKLNSGIRLGRAELTDLLIEYEEAKRYSPEIKNEASQRAFDFCQRALLKGRVVPGVALGNLSEIEHRRWRSLGCTQHFCASTIDKNIRHRAKCQWTDYGKKLIHLYDKRVNDICDRRARRNSSRDPRSLSLLTTIPRIPTTTEVSTADKHTIEVLLALGENARTSLLGHIRVRNTARYIKMLRLLGA